MMPTLVATVRLTRSGAASVSSVTSRGEVREREGAVLVGERVIGEPGERQPDERGEEDAAGDQDEGGDVEAGQPAVAPVSRGRSLRGRHGLGTIGSSVPHWPG